MKRIFDASCPGLFATVVEFVSESVIKENHGVSDAAAQFRASECENVDACFPRDFCGAGTEVGYRICEAGAIHVDFEVTIRAPFV